MHLDGTAHGWQAQAVKGLVKGGALPVLVHGSRAAAAAGSRTAAAAAGSAAVSNTPLR